MTQKTPLLSMLIAVLMLACSISDIPSLLQPAATIAPTDTPVPPTATPSPVVFPTHTFTPTLIGANTEIAATFPPPSTATPAPTTAATAATAATPSGGVPVAAATGLAGTGFDAINVSAPVFHWGACEPTTVTLTASVTNAAQIADLVLFTRAANKATGAATRWAKGISMSLVGPGVYSRTLNGSRMDITLDSWIEFQLVGTDSQGTIVVRSPVYHNALSLSPCP